MNMTFILIGFALAVFMGAAVAALLASLRPAWPRRKRILIAALALPLVTIVATAFGMAFLHFQSPDADESMRSLAVAAVGTIGSLFAIIAFGGGLLGAVLSQRRRTQ